MRRNVGKEAVALLVVLGAVIGAGGQAWSAGPRAMPDVERPTPIAATALASGSFRCGVVSIDPPNGTGVPEGSAGIEFPGYLGLIGTNMIENVFLGTGAGMNQVCQTLTDQMSSHARSLGCIAGPVRIVETVGGNFTQKEWSIDIVCVNQANGVVEAIGALIVDIISAPTAQLTLQRTSLESREPNSREGLRIPVQPMKQKLPADR